MVALNQLNDLYIPTHGLILRTQDTLWAFKGLTLQIYTNKVSYLTLFKWVYGFRGTSWSALFKLVHVTKLLSLINFKPKHENVHILLIEGLFERMRIYLLNLRIINFTSDYFHVWNQIREEKGNENQNTKKYIGFLNSQKGKWNTTQENDLMIRRP